MKGIIPARAGFTRHFGGGALRYPDHPRSRGVYLSASFSHEVIVGSSPLARGLPEGEAVGADGTGIIPARAGFTLRPSSGPRAGPDHPRSRGVYIMYGGSKAPERGSSPLARGLPVEGVWHDAAPRIIPARAGFTWWCTSAQRSTADHPRSRGVYVAARLEAEAIQGSSPLARGLRLGFSFEDTAARIIPARAGFTTRGGRTQRGCWDHPRSRGVYSATRSLLRSTPGSSPLARGLRSPPPPPRSPSSDHPRSRGVYLAGLV